MTGMAYWSIFKYYDSFRHKMAFKKRPVLIIGQADRNDYIVLPISRITHKENIDSQYDYRLSKEEFPLMRLKETSYIRTHKQAVANEGDLADVIVNFKEAYPKAFEEVIELVRKFQTDLADQALRIE